MNIRNVVSINSALGLSPLPNGFVSIPVYNFQDNTSHDDINTPGCPYVDKVDNYNFPADSTYSSVSYLIDDLRAPISEAFGLTSAQEIAMDFM